MSKFLKCHLVPKTSLLGKKSRLMSLILGLMDFQAKNEGTLLVVQ
jgi:hypothetical protein